MQLDGAPFVNHWFSRPAECALPRPPAENASAIWPINLVDPPVATSVTATQAGGGLGWCDPAKLNRGVYGRYPNVPGDACPSISIPTDRLWQEMRKTLGIGRMSNFIVNIGANDGIGGDPLYVLLQRYPHLSGIAIEPALQPYSKLVRHMAPFKAMRVVQMGISPSTAADELRKVFPNPSQNSIDYLKIEYAAKAPRNDRIISLRPTSCALPVVPSVPGDLRASQH